MSNVAQTDILTAVLGGNQEPAAPITTPPAVAQDPSTPAPPAPQPAQTAAVAQQPLSVDEVIKTITGGNIQNQTEFSAFFQEAANLGTMKATISELEAKANQAATFANPWVQKLNDLVSSGADLPTVASFAEMSMINVDTLSPMEALSKKISLQYKDMTREQVDAYLVDTYGHIPVTDDGSGVKVIDESSMPPAVAARLVMDGQAAKDYIKEQVVAFEKSVPATQSAPAVDAEMAKIQAAQVESMWKPIVSTINPALEMKIDPSEEDGRPEYSFTFQPKPEIVQAAREAVIAEMKANPQLYPATDETRQRIEASIKTLVELSSIDDFKRAMFMDVYNSVMQTAAQKYSGPIPRHQGGNPSSTPPSTAKPDLLDAVMGDKR